MGGDGISTFREQRELGNKRAGIGTLMVLNIANIKFFLNARTLLLFTGKLCFSQLLRQMSNLPVFSKMLNE